MKLRQLIPGIAFVAIAMMLVVMPMLNTSSNPSPAMAQEGPTATPQTLEWLAFSMARDALSEDISQRITYVKNYFYEYKAFPDGLAECRTLTEEEIDAGVELPVYYAGWTIGITLINNTQYEIRVSNDLAEVIICDEVTADAPFPGGVASSGDDDGSIPTNLGTVATGPLEVGAQVPNTLSSEAVTYLNQGNFKWVKVQARPGSSWTGFIADAHAQGFKVLLSTIGDHNRATDPAYHSEYTDYVAALASDGADAIEVWNEPNIDREWPTGQINGTSYVELLEKSYKAIKAANPNTIVITGGPAPTGAAGAAGCTDNLCNDDEFYKLIAQAGAAEWADCIGVHYNEGVVSPQTSSGDPRDNYPTRYFGSNLSRATQYFPGMPMCFTEIGYLSPEGYGSLSPLFAWGADTSVAEQAEWLAQAVVLASQRGDVRLMIVWNLNFTIWGDDPQAGYAIVRPDGSCPACDTIASVQ